MLGKFVTKYIHVVIFPKGEWKEEKMNGRGVYFYSDGSKFDGKRLCDAFDLLTYYYFYLLFLVSYLFVSLSAVQ